MGSASRRSSRTSRSGVAAARGRKRPPRGGDTALRLDRSRPGSWMPRCHGPERGGRAGVAPIQAHPSSSRRALHRAVPRGTEDTAQIVPRHRRTGRKVPVRRVRWSRQPARGRARSSIPASPALTHAAAAGAGSLECELESAELVRAADKQHRVDRANRRLRSVTVHAVVLPPPEVVFGQCTRGPPMRILWGDLQHLSMVWSQAVHRLSSTGKKLATLRAIVSRSQSSGDRSGRQRRRAEREQPRVRQPPDHNSRHGSVIYWSVYRWHGQWLRARGGLPE